MVFIYIIFCISLFYVCTNYLYVFFIINNYFNHFTLIFLSICFFFILFSQNIFLRRFLLTGRRPSRRIEPYSGPNSLTLSENISDSEQKNNIIKPDENNDNNNIKEEST